MGQRRFAFALFMLTSKFDPLLMSAVSLLTDIRRFSDFFARRACSFGNAAERAAAARRRDRWY